MEVAPTSQKATTLMCTFTQLLYIETHSGAERGHSIIKSACLVGGGDLHQYDDISDTSG